jgi:thiosulfate reductase cytochrome b subunit
MKQHWQFIYRHSLAVRITHWVNVICLLALLMSGLQIFNAHPALYWGSISRFGEPLVSMEAEASPSGPQGITTVFKHRFDTTGWLGLSSDPYGGEVARGFPSWATLPGNQWLALGRRWHFFFAWLFVINGAAYLAFSLWSRHLWYDLVPSASEIRDIPRSFVDHIRLRFPKGEAARRYNVLQKLSYLVVILLLLVMVTAGLTMSPAMDAAFPWLLDLFGGRQSARTIHFLIATLIVTFVLVHVVMVIVSGVVNNMRSMVTGRYEIAEDDRSEQGTP